MKLSRLVMRGVRSFGDLVEIDFARLGEEGLFAIVGPTGAGKSTLLDGIFLALFGRSPRGEASECVAVGANELVVRLEVLVRRGGVEELVAVERAWRWSRKRGQDELDVRGAARHAPLRVERKSAEGAWEPMNLGGAKAEAFVKAEVVRVSMADFQQAVVLPQGQFGALLGAKPTERRALVASLFRTEHLGAPLADVLRRREADVKGEIDRLAEAAREVAVDPEDVRAAEAEATRAGEEDKAASSAFEAGARFVDEVRRARDRCAARDEARASLRAFDGAAARLGEARSRAAVARRAALAADAVAAFTEAEAGQIEAEARDVEAKRAAHVAYGVLRVAIKEHAAAREKRAREAPGVGARLDTARAALERERAVERLRVDVAARVAARDRALAAAERDRAQHVTWDAARAAASAEVAARRSELEATRVGEAERSRALAEVAIAERDASTARVRAALRFEIEAAERVAGAASAAVLDAAKIAAGLLDASSRADAELEERALAAAREEREVDVARRSIDEARRRHAAAELAAGLRPGSPCPVCGAREHGDVDHGAGSFAVDAAERALESAQRFAAQTARARDEAELAARDLAERVRAARARELELDAARELAELRAQRVAAAEEIPRAVEDARANARRAEERVVVALAALDDEVRAAVVARPVTIAEAERLVGGLASRARAAEAFEVRVRAAVAARAEAEARADAARAAREATEAELARHAASLDAAASLLAEGQAELDALLVAVLPDGQRDFFTKLPVGARAWVEQLEGEIAALTEAESAADQRLEHAREEEGRLSLEAREASGVRIEGSRVLARARAASQAALKRSGFATADEQREGQIEPEALEALEASIAEDSAELASRRAVHEARARDVDVEVDPASAGVAEAALGEARRAAARAASVAATARERADELARRHARSLRIRETVDALAPRAERLARVRQVVAGGLLSELAAERHLEAVTRAAAVVLRSLSAERYGLVRRADGSFAVQDGAHGGVVRGPTTLSGGETFLVSLALALALAERVQVAGRTRFDFFFLDEGFGALDAATLELALAALERLREAGRVIGMISHVPAVEERMPRRLRVVPSRPRGRARVVHEL